MNRLGLTRTVVTQQRMRSSRPMRASSSALPGWSGCDARSVLISGVDGRPLLAVPHRAARRPDTAKGTPAPTMVLLRRLGRASPSTGRGARRGRFALRASRASGIVSAGRTGAEATPSVLLVFRKRYEPLPGHLRRRSFAGHEARDRRDAVSRRSARTPEGADPRHAGRRHGGEHLHLRSRARRCRSSRRT